MHYRIKTFPFPFDPHAQLDYQFRWVKWCARVGDSILDATITCDPGVVLVLKEVTGNIVTAWVKLDPAAPATIGSRPQVHCDITTASTPPRKDRRSFELNIIAR